MFFENIKVAVFDFDNTLAIHENPNYLNERLNNKDVFLKFYAEASKNPTVFYDNFEKCSAPKEMRRFVSSLKPRKIYLLTGMPFSFNFAAKKAFTHKHYGKNIECISTMDQHHKIEAIQIIQYINGCKPEEILFVDDIPENIQLAQQAGFTAVLASDIINKTGIYFMKWERVKPLLSHEFISDFEIKTKYKFQQEFKEIVKQYNGGRPTMSGFCSSGFHTGALQNRTVKCFLSFNEPDKNNVWTAYDKMYPSNDQKPTTAILIPFAIDDSGNYICFDKLNDSIQLYNNEDCSVEFIADTFLKFIDKLHI